jgi:RNA polymerase sigma-70 factor (ECF subfamily)
MQGGVLLEVLVMEGSCESIDDATRPSLLLRVRDPADAAAWGVFAEIYGPIIYSYCRRSSLQETDASDVSQEVMIRVSSAIQRFEYDPVRGGFRHWLGRVTRNEIARFFQAKGRHPASLALSDRDVDQANGAPSESHWDEHFHTALLDVAIRRIEPLFEPSTWQAFQSVWIEDCTPEAASQALGLPVEKVYVAKSRVLKRLREERLLLCEDNPTFQRNS